MNRGFWRNLISKIGLFGISVILISLFLGGLGVSQASAIEGASTSFFVSSSSGKATILVRFRGLDYQNVNSCKLSSRSPFIDQQNLSVVNGADARYCVWSGNLGASPDLLNMKIVFKLGSEIIHWSNPTLYKSKPLITSATSQGNKLSLQAVTLDPQNTGFDIRVNVEDNVGLKDCSLSGNTNAIKKVKVYDQFCDISLGTQTSPSSVTVQAKNYFGNSSSVTINFIAPSTAPGSVKPKKSEQASEKKAKAAKTVKKAKTTISAQSRPLNAELISATNGKVVISNSLDKTQISSRKNFFETSGTGLIIGAALFIAGVIIFIRPKWLKPKKISIKLPPKQIKMAGIVLVVIGFGTMLYSVASLNNASIEAKIDPFIDTESTQKVKGDVANLVGSLGSKTANLSTSPSIKAHYPFAQSPYEAPALKTDIQLQVAVAEGIDQKKIFGSEAVITSYSDLVKPFNYQMEGDKPSKLFWQVTEGVPFETCANYKSGVSKYISTELTSGEGSAFSIDFKKVLLPGFLSGKYNGEMSFFVRLVAIGDGDNCNQRSSNVVKLTFKPNSSFQELSNPKASILQLYTTGADKLASQGEFTNQVTESQLDWQASVDKKIYNFGIKELNDMPKYGQWQVSVVPFNNNSCKSPYGIVAYQDITPTTNPMFAVDFSKVAMNQPGNSYLFDNLSPVGNLASSLKKTLYPGSEKPKSSNDINQSLYDQFIKDKDFVNYYVRFVALDLSNGSCDASYKPSTTVKVGYGLKTKPTDIKVPKTENHYIEVSDKAEFKIEKIEFVPVKFQEDKFDPAGHYVYTTDVWEANWDTGHLAHQKGDKTYIPPNKIKKDKDLWDYVRDVIDSIDEFFKALYKIVNFVANSYNNIKGELVSQIAKGLTALGAPCEDICQMVISSGLGIGQAALGMPPSLPNFDQMMDQGVDYLVKEISSQMTGAELPFTQDFVESTSKKTLGGFRQIISKHLADEAVKQKAPMKPDPDYLYNPAQLKVTIKNVGTETGSGSIDFRYTESTPGLDVDLVTRDLFVPAKLNVPLVNPGESLTIPIVLTENYKDYGNSAKDKSSGLTCTKGSQQVDCGNQVQSGVGPLANQQYRWENNYKTAPTGTLTLNSGHGLGLPVDFSPVNYGFNSAKWQKIGNYSGGISYYDIENNTYHNFYPKSSTSYSKSTQKVISHKPFDPMLVTY